MRRREHEQAAKILFGRAYTPAIEVILDDPQQVRAYRAGHRVTTHNWQTLEAIRQIFGRVGYLQAWLHLALDYGVFGARSSHSARRPSREKRT